MKKLLALLIVFLMVFSTFSILAPGVKAEGEIKRLINKFKQTLSELENLANVLDEAVVIDYLDQSLQQLKLDVEELDLDPETKDSLLDKLNAAIEKIDEAKVLVLDGKEKQTNNMINAISNILEAIIHEVEALRDIKIPEEDADNLVEKTQSILENSKKRGRDTLTFIEGIELELLREVRKRADDFSTKLREIISELQEKGIQVELVIVRKSPLVMEIVILGVKYVVIPAVVSFWLTSAMSNALKDEGVQLSVAQWWTLYGINFAAILGIEFALGTYAATVFWTAIGMYGLGFWPYALVMSELTKKFVKDFLLEIVAGAEKELIFWILSIVASETYVPLGTGVSFTYNKIPFEIWGVLVHVFHTGTDFVPTQSLDLSGYIAEKIHIMVFAAWSDNVPDGVIVGHISIYYTDGTSTTLNLIMGVNIAEWAYDRPELQPYLQHTKIPAAYSWWTNVDSSYYYWGHCFYVLIDTEEKPLSRLELILDPASYTGQKYYGYAPADWFGIKITAVTLEVLST